jgi:hypothetical protein
MPASAANGCSVEFAGDFIEQRFPFEELAVFSRAPLELSVADWGK